LQTNSERKGQLTRVDETVRSSARLKAMADAVIGTVLSHLRRSWFVVAGSHRHGRGLPPPLQSIWQSISQSTLPIAKWPPERLLHLVIDGAAIHADVTQAPLVELRELAARHAAAAPRAQASDDPVRDHAPARVWCPGRADLTSGRRLLHGRCRRFRNLRGTRVPKPGRSDRLRALL
jgi:hypothetical protein